MKKSFQKLLISVLSLTLAISLFGTVVYAWFSISAISILHNVNIGIAADGFEISLDGINYKKEISAYDLRDYIKYVALTDVTSIDGITFKKGGPKSNVDAQENIDYLRLTLYFRTYAKDTASPSTVMRNVFLVDNVSSEAYLNRDIDGTYIISKGVNWQADVTFLNGLDPINDVVYAGERYVIYAAEAIRIGFIERKLSYGNSGKDDGGLVNKIFDLSRHPERGYGVNFGSLDYYNKKYAQNLTPPNLVQDVTTALTEFDELDPRFPYDYNSLIASMVKTDKYHENGDVYYEAKVDMTVWLEGWDADCFDAIHHDKITLKLKFKNARDIINL